MVDVNGTTIIQTGTPEELLGRVFGAFDGVLILAMLAGAVIVGPLIELLGPRTTTVVFAVVALVIFLLCLPRLRKLDRVLGARMFVRKVPVLAGLSHAVLEDLASRMTLEKVPDGTVVVSQGEVGHRLYIVGDGEAEVAARGEDGQEKGSLRRSRRTTTSGRLLCSGTCRARRPSGRRARWSWTPWNVMTSRCSWSAPRSSRDP